jgi:DNA-damage-inducible protein D
MEPEQIKVLKNKFDEIVNEIPDSNIEFWFARNLQKVLGYSKWQNFQSTIARAIESCETSGLDAQDHFRPVSKTIEVGKGASRNIDDLMVTRYGCYLIAQNGDPRKEEIAFAQSYFALQTRKQELIEDRLELQERLNTRQKLRESEKEFSQAIYERGVDNAGFARIRSRGDQTLFGGITTQGMKEKYGITSSRPLADFLPTLVNTAKLLATQITTHNVKSDNLRGERAIKSEHVVNNQSLRDVLQKRGITPEDLPPEEDIKKLERRVKSEAKKLGKAEKLPPKKTG